MDVLTKKSRKPKKEPLRTARKVLVADLKVGMKIVARWHKPLEINFEDHIPEGLTEDQQLDWIYEASQLSYVAKSKPIKSIDECPGKWRTHIHVNRTDCYDTRQFEWVVNE